LKSEAELAIFSKYFHKLSEKAKSETDLSQTHSIEEAEELHVSKYKP